MAKIATIGAQRLHCARQCKHRFVKPPSLPPTNNEAERALRHAVIARAISYGTRTPEGSLAYSCLLSVMETCRLRRINPWTYIAQVLALARKGVSPPPVPVGS